MPTFTTMTVPSFGTTLARSQTSAYASKMESVISSFLSKHSITVSLPSATAEATASADADADADFDDSE